MVQTTLCTPIPAYIIEEKVYHKLGWGKVAVNSKNVGVDAYQVTRKIVQTCLVQDIFIDGKPIRSSPTGWQLLKDFIGLEKIETKPRPNAKKILLLAYSGYENIFEAFGERADPVDMPGLFKYGKDPMPHVKLYGNENVTLYMSGGQGVPTAIAIYDAHNGLRVIPRERQNQLLEELNASVANFSRK